jgi:hypothetical protein
LDEKKKKVSGVARSKTTETATISKIYDPGRLNLKREK